MSGLLIRVGILAALDTVAAIIDLDRTVDRLSSRYVVERGLEEFALPGRSYVRNNDDQPGVQRGPVVESEKIGSVIGHECVVVFENERHQFPVFKAAQAQMIDMIGDMTRVACEVNKGQMQAFIN